MSPSSAIAAGKFDAYLSAYAVTVRAYRHPVILSFGHEMNGSWSSWGYSTHPRGISWRPGGTSSRSSARWERERNLAVDSQHRQRHAARPYPPARSDGGRAVPT